MRLRSCFKKLTASLCVLMVFTACYFPAGGSKAEEKIEKTLPLSEGGKISLENVNGKIKLTTWEKPEFHMVATKRSKAPTVERAKELLGKTEVVVSATPDEIKIETKCPKKGGMGIFGSCPTAEVEYEIQIPEGVSASLTTVNGHVTADSPKGSLKVNTVNGTVEILGATLLEAGTVNGKIGFKASSLKTVETTNGSIEGLLVGPQTANGTIETVNGSISLRVAEGVAIAIEAENVNGSISCSIPGFSTEKHKVAGRLNAGSETVRIETVNGSIKISAESKAQAEAE